MYPPLWSIFSHSILLPTSPVPPSHALHTTHSFWDTLLSNRDLPIILETRLSGKNQGRKLNQLHWRIEDCVMAKQYRWGELHLVFSTETFWILWSHCAERTLLRVLLGPSPNPLFSETLGPKLLLLGLPKEEKNLEYWLYKAENLALVSSTWPQGSTFA